MAKAFQVADVRDQLTVQELEPLASTPADFSAAIVAEIDKWAKLV